ncbi:unnamed protein product [Pleuronectes platessa]|uniref:Uncharacterized protein n=1 Tax=Pleuronectes platessa TaxID=8262 RepID=A0A9N7UDR2_PLEPL|nr:unnamed protein product [Pleuronectes platessa]
MLLLLLPTRLLLLLHLLLLLFLSFSPAHRHLALLRTADWRQSAATPLPHTSGEAETWEPLNTEGVSETWFLTFFQKSDFHTIRSDSTFGGFRSKERRRVKSEPEGAFAHRRILSSPSLSPLSSSSSSSAPALFDETPGFSPLHTHHEPRRELPFYFCRSLKPPFLEPLEVRRLSPGTPQLSATRHRRIIAGTVRKSVPHLSK